MAVALGMALLWPLSGCGGRSAGQGPTSQGGASTDGGKAPSKGGTDGAGGRAHAGAPSPGGAAPGGSEQGGTPSGGAAPGGNGGAPVTCGTLGQVCCEPQGLACEPGLLCTASKCEWPPQPPNYNEVLGAPSSFGNPGWKDSWFVVGCPQKDGIYCQTADPCPPGGVTTEESFPISGKPGVRYQVTFGFSAVLSPKLYEGGVLDAQGITPIERSNHDTFYRDGAPVDSNAETWQLTVIDEDGLPARHYYMNAFSAEYQSERTYQANFQKTIVVIGGGTMRHTVHNPDCRVVDNWVGPSSDDTTPRLLPGPPAILPQSYQDPATGQVVATELLSSFGDGRNQPWHAQAGHLLITKIEETSDPVTHDY